MNIAEYKIVALELEHFFATGIKFIKIRCPNRKLKFLTDGKVATANRKVLF